MQTLANIFWLGTKELRSFLHDYVLLGLVVYAFSLAVIAQAQGSSQEVHNASVAIVDEDRSELSRRIAHAFLPPYFQAPQPIAERDIVPLMNTGKYTFVIDIPPNFTRDVVAGRRPTIQLNVDATAMVQAGLGAGYAQETITTEIGNFLLPWREKYGDRDPNWASRGWDGVMLTVKAIETAKSFEGPKLRDTLETIKGFQGTTGIYNFSAENHQGITENPFVLATIKDGEVKVVQ